MLAAVVRQRTSQQPPISSDLRYNDLFDVTAFGAVDVRSSNPVGPGEVRASIMPRHFGQRSRSIASSGIAAA